MLENFWGLQSAHFPVKWQIFIHIAILENQKERGEVLISKGADVNAIDLFCHFIILLP